MNFPGVGAVSPVMGILLLFRFSDLGGFLGEELAKHIGPGIFTLSVMLPGRLHVLFLYLSPLLSHPAGIHFTQYSLLFLSRVFISRRVVGMGGFGIVNREVQVI